MVPNGKFQGLLNHGADLLFRRWGKIETPINARGLSVWQHSLLDRLDRIVTSSVNILSRSLKLLSPYRRLNGAWVVLRAKILKRMGTADIRCYDEFVLECFCSDDRPFRLVLELAHEGRLVFRDAFSIQQGHNFHTLAASRFGTLSPDGDYRLTLYPEDNQERRLVFTWLDFVTYRQGQRETRIVPKAQPAVKVKCVAWDLDNTLWSGILLEEGTDKLALRAGIVEVIEQLDARGILQTVVSKNNHDDAWRVIKRFGLEDFFLYPAINWGQKSANLKQIADQLNINIDTFALIDDSSFERAEVEASLPMVRTYSEQEIVQLLARAEFAVPVTQLSGLRRQSYLVEMRRERAKASFTGDYENFLRSCHMRMRLFVPKEEADVDRCMELMQRSNQLNLSTRRYTEADFRTLLTTTGMMCLALECEDRFGKYGIVGFSCIDERGEIPRIVDFILSCRVAQKRVEHTFYLWLAIREQKRGCHKMLAELIKTSRNQALVKVFEELPFKVAREEEPKVLLEMSLDGPLDLDNIIELLAEVEG
jgi:FkbH-like protein